MGVRSALVGAIAALAAIVIGMPVAFFYSALGLLVAEPVMLVLGFPVAFLAAGLSAALAASWMANLVAPDRSRTRLFTALAWGALAGACGALAFLAAFFARGAFGGGPLGQILLPIAAPVCLAPTIAALRRRDAKRSLRRDALWSLGILLLVGASWYGVVGIACLFDACGA